MSSSLVITIKSGRAVGDLARFIRETSSPRAQALVLQQFFERAKSGLESCSFDVQTAAAAPVRATNTLTLTYASISNNDTVVIAGVTLTCVTGTPSGQAQFKKVTNLATTLANLIACVNAHTTLNLLMLASSASAGVCTLTLFAPGAVGNQVPLVGSTGMVVGAATFASGAGGCETTPVTYSRGL